MHIGRGREREQKYKTTRTRRRTRGRRRRKEEEQEEQEEGKEWKEEAKSSAISRTLGHFTSEVRVHRGCSGSGRFPVASPCCISREDDLAERYRKIHNGGDCLKMEAKAKQKVEEESRDKYALAG